MRCTLGFMTPGLLLNGLAVMGASLFDLTRADIRAYAMTVFNIINPGLQRQPYEPTVKNYEKKHIIFNFASFKNC